MDLTGPQQAVCIDSFKLQKQNFICFCYMSICYVSSFLDEYTHTENNLFRYFPVNLVSNIESTYS